MLLVLPRDSDDQATSAYHCKCQRIPRHWSLKQQQGKDASGTSTIGEVIQFVFPFNLLLSTCDWHRHREVFLIGVRKPEYRRLPVACLPLPITCLAPKFLETHGVCSSHLFISPLVANEWLEKSFVTLCVCVCGLAVARLQVRSVYELLLSSSVAQTCRV
jgi:hypothetical protein